MNLNQKQIGRYIQEARRAQGLTQAELGERLGVSPQSVSHWECGESIPDVSILPDLAGILRCTVDAILLGGEGCIGYRRHVTVARMREAMQALASIGTLLGHDHFIYRTIIDALNARMNTSMEDILMDAHLQEVFTIECLLACLENGDYVDPMDVQLHLKECRARDILLDALRAKGYR